MILKKLANMVQELKTANRTKEAELVQDALNSIIANWEEPTDEELMSMELGLYEPFEEELNPERILEQRFQKLQTEMNLFQEAARDGKLTPEDLETYQQIQTEFAELMMLATSSSPSEEEALN